MLGDFSELFDGNQGQICRKIAGTPKYFAPELRKMFQEGIEKQYNPWKSDLYSLGLTILMLSNSSYKKIDQSNIKLCIKEATSRYGQDLGFLLSMMLEENFEKRFDLVSFRKQSSVIEILGEKQQYGIIKYSEIELMIKELKLLMQLKKKYPSDRTLLLEIQQIVQKMRQTQVNQKNKLQEIGRQSLDSQLEQQQDGLLQSYQIQSFQQKSGLAKKSQKGQSLKLKSYSEDISQTYSNFCGLNPSKNLLQTPVKGYPLKLKFQSSEIQKEDDLVGEIVSPTDRYFSKKRIIPSKIIQTIMEQGDNLDLSTFNKLDFCEEGEQ